MARAKANTGVTQKLQKPKTEFDVRIQAQLAKYAKDFRIDDMNESNDRALLMTLIRSEIILEELQVRLQGIISDGDLVEEATEIKKLSDLIRDLTNQTTTLQKTLGIDRKSRKDENESSIADQIKMLKRNAHEFFDRRMIKVYCPDCKVMVNRIMPVHDHTQFFVETRCSQCERSVIARREQRDIWFDVRDADWRRKHKAEIVQPKKTSSFRPEDVETENIVDLFVVDNKAEFDIEIDTDLIDLEENIRKAEEAERNAQASTE